ncbi:MAG: AAC(3) family N-acetyltransferase [Anaerolineales bacterium]|nr:AAC(3) family N-acetyltransferase [Anaerolineales bacterium]
MKDVTPEQIKAMLTVLGIRRGNGLLIHSAIQYLGRPVTGPQIYLDVILGILGREGTLAAPTFNFEFAKGQPYDPSQTSSLGMGVFSELVRCHPLACRTLHPMQSISVIGRHRDELVALDTPCAFDPGSAFEHMLELDFKLLLLGAEVQAASMVHYCEQRANVPYRHWKDFEGTVIIDNVPEKRTYRMFVRDLQINAELELLPIERKLQEHGQWSEAALNYGKIAICTLKDFVATTDELLRDDPWILIKNRPVRT